jgi:hypothetical protein
VDLVFIVARRGRGLGGRDPSGLLHGPSPICAAGRRSPLLLVALLVVAVAPSASGLASFDARASLVGLAVAQPISSLLLL